MMTREEWLSAVDEMHNDNSNCNKGTTDIVHTTSVSASTHAAIMVLCCRLSVHGFVMSCGSVVQQCCLAYAQDDNYSIKQSQAIVALGLCDIGGVLRSNPVTDFLKLRIGCPHFCIHYPCKLFVLFWYFG